MTATSRRRGTSSPQKPATVRVAVYCRVSTDDRLDMEFNSLDAQRQAVEAYVESQRGEGWVALRERYTDGGYTGANTQRPAFERLLNDVETGKVDCVAVYKIDRLSRSLVDFARIMDLFERSGVSFLSVTQQFTTTSSMGRLTLNILMSFAEFERQTIAERTRDKMAAARKKGLWTGGVPPLGYRVENKRLVLNEQEAEVIREIFQLYLDVGSAFAVAGELNRRGWKTKTGRVFDRHSVQRILTNPLYAGKVRSEGQLYDGAHEATVDQETWEAVERNLKRSGKRRGGRLGAKSGAFLGGLVRCGVCGSAIRCGTTAVWVAGRSTPASSRSSESTTTA